MKAIPHSHILVVWPGSDPFRSESESLSLLFFLVPPDTNTTPPQVFLSLKQVGLLIKAVLGYNRLCVAVPEEPLGYPVFYSVEKGGRPALLLKATASTKASSRRGHGCPGFNKAAASGRQGSDVPSQAENRRNTVPRGGLHIIWLQGRGSCEQASLC